MIDQCKKCNSKNLEHMEYKAGDPEYYDGISEIICRDCGARFGRWSGRELKEGEIEKKYGGLNPLLAKARMLPKRRRKT